MAHMYRYMYIFSYIPYNNIHVCIVCIILYACIYICKVNIAYVYYVYRAGTE